jgi:DNA-binding response OmpR family regulator
MNSKSIVIVEDDPALLRGLKDNFTQNGFEVWTAKDGAMGYEAILEKRPDVVLLDIMLPKMNGFEICRSVRLEKLDMPIIMLSAKGQEEDVVRGLDLGADDYVTKPFGIRSLLARVNAFLRRRGRSEETQYAFGNCVLDLGAHKLFRGAEEIILTSKEFNLLLFFLRRPGRALTRQNIMNEVWGSDIIVTARSVDRCVTTLRGKIEPGAGEPALIQTIREVGYRFEPPENGTHPQNQKI